MTQSRARAHVRADWACFAGICLFALVLRIPLAGIPLERDEGEYAYIAQRWMQGDVPYRDAFNQKLPAAFVIYVGFERLFGTSPSAIHWGMQVYTLGTLGALFLLGRQLSSPAAGLAAAALAAFMTADPGVLGNAANTENLMLLPLTAAMLALCLAVERDSLWWAFVAGACAVTAVLFKQVAVFNLLLVLVLVAWMARRRTASVAMVLLGSACVVLPLLTYFAAHGALGDLFDATIAHNLHYTGRLSLTAYPRVFWQASQPLRYSFWPILLLAAAQGVTGLSGRSPLDRGATRHTTRRNTLLVLAWFGASFASTASGGYFRLHYFAQLIPSIAVLAGMLVGRLELRRFGPAVRPAIRAALVVVPIGLGLLAHAWYFLPGDVNRKLYLLYGDNPFVESPAVGRFIAERSEERDTVFILGSEPQILYYAQRKSATRYILMYPLTGPFSDARERQLVALREITQSRPRFIVTVLTAYSFLAEATSPPDLPDALSDLVEQSYRLAAVVPATQGAAATLVTGDPALEVWRQAPSSCCSLAVWERVAPAPSAF